MSDFVMLTQIQETTGREIYTKLSDEARCRTIETRHRLRPVLIAVNHICFLREDEVMKELLANGDLPPGLDKDQSFTSVQLSRGSSYDACCFTVVGHLETVASKIRDASKRD